MPSFIQSFIKHEESTEIFNSFSGQTGYMIMMFEWWHLSIWEWSERYSNFKWQSLSTHKIISLLKTTRSLFSWVAFEFVSWNAPTILFSKMILFLTTLWKLAWLQMIMVRQNFPNFSKLKVYTILSIFPLIIVVLLKILEKCRNFAKEHFLFGAPWY